MGMRPALALTLYNSEVQNTPVIHSATLHCNFLLVLWEDGREMLFCSTIIENHREQ